MTRLKRTLHGVISSYILLATTMLYSLGSVPVSLHYLDKSRFGLWVLMGTLAGFLNLIDGGVSGASNRMLIEHKDQQDGGQYGALIKTSSLVFLIQGLIVFLAGLVFSRPFAHLMAIPQSLTNDFVNLLVVQCAIIAIGFSTRIFGVILGAHQRLDFCNYAGAVGLILNFFTQWIFFFFGCGVFSMAVGMVAGSITVILIQGLLSWRLNLFPSAGCWGSFSWSDFKELFLFSKDLLLSSIGTSLIRASPSIVITRLLGLESAAVWGVGTRAFTLLNQIVWKITDMSGGAFAEMMVRGEVGRLKLRYFSLATLSFSLAGWVAISFAFTNSLFISIWTHGKISWSVENDCLLAILMITSSIAHCHNYFILNTRKIVMIPYVYLLEGVVFVALSFLFVRWGGLPAIILSSILCSIIFSSSYGVFRISQYFEIPLYEVALTWLEPMFKMMICYLPISCLIWLLSSGSTEMFRFVVQFLISLIIGVPLFLYFCIPASLKNDFSSRIPLSIKPIISRVFLQ